MSTFFTLFVSHFSLAGQFILPSAITFARFFTLLYIAFVVAFHLTSSESIFSRTNRRSEMNEFVPDSAKPFRLRQRRGVHFRLGVSSCRSEHGGPDFPSVGHPSSPVLIEGGNLAELFGGISDPCEESFETAFDVPTETEPPMGAVLYDGQRVIPGVFVALTDQPGGTSEVDSELGFTHVISIAPSSHPGATGTSEQSVSASGVNKLHITVPVAHPYRMAEDKFRLQKWQLVRARDFLSLALPYTRDRPPPVEINDVRVLVLAPFGCYAEALGVVLTYIGFLSDRSIVELIEHIDQHEFLDVWKHTISSTKVIRLLHVATEMMI